MSHSLTIELSESAFNGLESRARATTRSLSELATETLEQRFGGPTDASERVKAITEVEKRVARERFEGHFGAVNLGAATGVDNDAIDADLARTYADNHEDE